MRLPGVLFASIEGDTDRATEVRLVVGEDPPVSEILQAVRAALDEDAAEFPLGAFFNIQVASVGDESPYLQSRVNEDPVAADPTTTENGSPRLLTHQVSDVSPGVIGVELTLGLAGHRFAGGASGKANLPGRNRVPALATLSALGSYIRFASNGGGPTLALESVSEFSLSASRVVVVVVTMSGHAVPLIASWPLTDASGPAVIRATLEATARRVTRLSMGRDRPPREATEPTEPVEVAGVAGSGGILRQQAESLLESAGPIASAHMVLDSVKGCRIHVLATAEISKSEVSRVVMTLLEEGLDLRVRSDQITVAQSRLSREELDRVLRPTRPSTPANGGTDVTDGLQRASANASATYVSRPTLVDLNIVAKMGGKREVGVRIVGGGGSFDGRCEADGGGVALLRPLAEATLDAVGALMQRGGREVALVLEDVRRFRKGGDDGVVVLVEVMVDGHKTLSSGAAFSVDSLERASVLAVLQATNAFVAGGAPVGGAPAGVPEIQPCPVSRTSQPPRPQTGAAALRDPSPEKPSDSLKASTPNDYVSEVLSRLQSGTSRRPGWTAPGLPEPD
jgi:hypothetical protein